MGVIQRQGLKNAVVAYMGIALGALNIILIQPLFLSKSEIGLTRILYSFSAVIATFVPLGVAEILIKYFPNFRNREQRHYGIFGFAVGLTFAGFLLASFLLLVFKPFITAQYNRESPLFNQFYELIFPLIFFIAFSNIFYAYSTALFKTVIPSFLNDVAVRLLGIILFGIYYLKWINLQQLMLLYVIKFGIITLLHLMYILSVDKPSLRLDIRYFLQQKPKQILLYGFLLSFTALSGLGLKYIDIIMLGKYLPLEYVGIYSIAVFIPTIIEVPVSALNKIGIASAAEAWKRNDMDEVRKIYYRSSRYLLMAGCFLFLCVNLNTLSLFQLFPQKGFDPGASVVLIISIGAVINMATGLNDAILFTSEEYKYGSAMLLFLFAFSVLNNYIFIPLWGMNGAAFATALSS
ncbi:MAG: hypothetical protein RMJ53_09185, partial [Chitinophagales bacterium]|nr:hypothetical protein [Chitinophagales bacterium]